MLIPKGQKVKRNKPKRYQNRAHLEFVAGKPCCLSGGLTFCSGRIQGHHLLKPWIGPRGGKLRANDKNAIPLCTKHHTELHAAGNEIKFFTFIGFDPKHGQTIAKTLWRISPHYEQESEYL